jgi:mRNA-degrading endonuclease toxin of MazEF toxin-antitoxin module
VWVGLDPARGAEVPKTRPCVIVSRTEGNDISSTVTIVPLSSVRGRAVERLVQPLRWTKMLNMVSGSRLLPPPRKRATRAKNHTCPVARYVPG